MESTESSLQWWAHPARERAGATILAGLVILGLMGAVYRATENTGWAAFAGLVVALSLERFFFPSRFQIDADGISSHCLFTRRRMAWRDVRRFSHDDRGAYLGMLKQPSRMDEYRGLHVLYGRRRDEVLPCIRAQLAAARRVEERAP